MRLPFLRSKQDPVSERGRSAASAAGDAPLDATQARTRARQRLVGALVLLAVGVIGFPLLFETQPRPLAANTPIEIVRQDGSVSVATTPAAAGKVRPVTLPPPDAGIEAGGPAASVPAPAPEVVQAPPAPAPKPAPAPVAEAPKPAAQPAPAPTPAPTPAASPPPAAAEQAARYVVQAGAYLDADSLRQARQRVEKLGLKTYTQVVETPGGKRTRVRVGPFENRGEADAVAARIKATGLSVVVLTL